ncbi:MAG: FumA C-terminus/TtdB family hydratase beta subunit [Candidatus Omnitrophica bacterium]|nr:FumA C-terminus/TtdB family hydratase beta subunit [Candidatus Omnitrophota bacterium]MDD5236249.1 FumA C-terminus/TtdB family hydratase beta subunit [Candidatus Omnitrophota bacterium]MDD5611035.1 FumA C-terminus/TtdB family hydratase beta subunit [Candidatus Omnitrophota bacterium]
MKRIYLPLTGEIIKNLHTGEELLLSGTLYTARDQAHKRLVEAIKKRKRLPLDLKDQIIYYCGPTATPKGKAIGSCGPTTASRMDRFAPILLKAGVKAMIGKGRRSAEVVKAIKKYKCVYFLAPAGLGALLSTKVRSKELIAYPELGPEAIYKLKVKDFPVIVGIDSKGKDIYK